MKKILVLACLFTTVVKAQLAPVVLRTEQNHDNSFTIFAENNSHANYTVRLLYRSLRGYKTSLEEYSLAFITRGTSTVANITPDKSASIFSLQYSYVYYMGRALTRIPDTAFSYLLPGIAGKSLMVSKTSSMSALLKQKDENILHTVGFVFKMGDTICATRAGIIIEISDTVNIGEKQSQTYSQQRNKITVEHQDGTLGYYSILAPMKKLVQLGDKVIPGQPLAVFNKENEKYVLLFTVNYLDYKNVLAFNAVNNKFPNYYISLPVKWILDNQKGGYLDSKVLTPFLNVVHPMINIGSEMSKREKKKYGIL